MSILVAGCADFIGSGFMFDWLAQAVDAVQNLRLVHKTTNHCAQEHERCIAWYDPAIGIQWPIDGVYVLAAKGQQGKPLAAAEHFA